MAVITTDLDEFTRAYIETALWSSTDNDDKSLDDEYGISNISLEALAKMTADCAQFQHDNAEWIQIENRTRDGEYTPDEYAGHDFWLTRNGHGAGFWDGDWSEPAATMLTNAAKAYGSFDLYVGDDGEIHGS